ncbi:MAG: type II secretion system protein [Clostridia bacterium]
MLKFFTKALKENKGFSLIELIVVIAILGVLAGVAAPNVIGYIDMSKRKADIASARTIANTVMASIAAGETSIPSSDGTYAVSELTEVIDKLQSAPKPQYDTDAEFIVGISSNGAVRVGVGTNDDDDTIEDELYPNVDTEYQN